MTIYRNAKWTRRERDCTNVVFQEVPDGWPPISNNGGKLDDGDWVKADAMPGDVVSLFRIAGRQFYGYM